MKKLGAMMVLAGLTIGLLTGCSLYKDYILTVEAEVHGSIVFLYAQLWEVEGSGLMDRPQNWVVRWGDGTISTTKEAFWTSKAPIYGGALMWQHAYSASGHYTITVTVAGQCRDLDVIISSPD